MLEKLKAYWGNLFTHHELNTIATDGLCCIDISPTSFSIAYARNDKGKINLILCATYPYKSDDDLQSSLETLVRYHQLENINCGWILQSDQYQLLLTEALPVPSNEFQAAIRWKIKDLVRFPINEVVIDKFSLPLKKATTAQEMIMVVIAKASDLKLTSKKLEKSGLKLSMINILELSLRNIAGLFDQEDKSSTLIYIQEKNSQLIITNKKLLHFARRIELGESFLSSIQAGADAENQIAKKMDRLALEIQRSFDYYQSQWRQPLPAKIIFSSIKSFPFDIAPLLSQRLSIPVEKLNLSQFLTNPKALSIEDQGKYLPILGGLFSYEGDSNAATN